MIKQIKNFFITALIGGFVVLLPIALFIFVISFLFRLVNNILEPVSNFVGVNFQTQDPLLMDAIAFVLVLVLCFLVGLFVQTQIGKTSFSFVERSTLERLPFYKTIKDIVQQFTGAKKAPFEQVVVADVFGNGTKMTGFVTAELEEGRYTIFVPTAPNPTNGFVFHVNKEQLEFLDMDTQDAMRTVIGMGAGSQDLK